MELKKGKQSSVFHKYFFSGATLVSGRVFTWKRRESKSLSWSVRWVFKKYPQDKMPVLWPSTV